MSNFRVGQKVVCVDGNFSPSWKQDAIRCLPNAGAVYTVRKVGTFYFRDEGELPAIWLEELVNPVTTWDPIGFTDEIGFWAPRFRPVVERKTDISFAHEILRKVTRKDRVRA